MLFAGALVGALGAAVGVVLGIAVARAGLATFGADLGAGYFRGIAPQLAVHPLEVATFFALGVAAALVATLGPAREAASVPAAVALKAGDEAPIAARRHSWVAAALAVAGCDRFAICSGCRHPKPIGSHVPSGRDWYCSDLDCKLLAQRRYQRRRRARIRAESQSSV